MNLRHPLCGAERQANGSLFISFPRTSFSVPGSGADAWLEEGPDKLPLEGGGRWMAQCAGEF